MKKKKSKKQKKLLDKVENASDDQSTLLSSDQDDNSTEQVQGEQLDTGFDNQPRDQALDQDETPYQWQDYPQGKFEQPRDPNEAPYADQAYGADGEQSLNQPHDQNYAPYSGQQNGAFDHYDQEDPNFYNQAYDGSAPLAQNQQYDPNGGPYYSDQPQNYQYNQYDQNQGYPDQQLDQNGQPYYSGQPQNYQYDQYDQNQGYPDQQFDQSSPQHQFGQPLGQNEMPYSDQQLQGYVPDQSGQQNQNFSDQPYAGSGPLAPDQQYSLGGEQYSGQQPQSYVPDQYVQPNANFENPPLEQGQMSYPDQPTQNYQYNQYAQNQGYPGQQFDQNNPQNQPDQNEIPYSGQQPQNYALDQYTQPANQAFAQNPPTSVNLANASVDQPAHYETNKDEESKAYKLAEINANLTKQILERIDEIDSRIKQNEEKIDRIPVSLQHEFANAYQYHQQNENMMQQPEMPVLPEGQGVAYSAQKRNYPNVADKSTSQKYNASEANTSFSEQILDKIQKISDRIKQNEDRINYQSASLRNQLANLYQIQSQGFIPVSQYGQPLVAYPNPPIPYSNNNSDVDGLAYKLVEMNANLTKKILDRIENISNRVKSNGKKIEQQTVSFQNQLETLSQTQQENNYPVVQPAISFVRPLNVYQPISRFNNQNDQSGAVFKLAEMNANLTKQILDRIDSIDDEVKLNGEKIEQQKVNNEILKIKLSHKRQVQNNGLGQVCFSPKIALVADYPNALNGNCVYPIVSSTSPLATRSSASSSSQTPSSSHYELVDDSKQKPPRLLSDVVASRINRDSYSEREKATQNVINSSSLPNIPADKFVDELPYIGYNQHVK